MCVCVCDERSCAKCVCVCMDHDLLRSWIGWVCLCPVQIVASVCVCVCDLACGQNVMPACLLAVWPNLISGPQKVAALSVCVCHNVCGHVEICVCCVFV